MKPSIVFSALLALALAAVSPVDTTYDAYSDDITSYGCGDACTFTFCFEYLSPTYGMSSFMIGKFNNRAFTPAICDKYRNIIVGFVGSTGEAYVVDSGKKILVSDYAPYGLEQNFSPSFFKPFAFDKGQHSGIGHDIPQGNQLEFLDNKCIVVPLAEYEVLDTYGNIKDVVHASSDCVAFRSTVLKNRG